MGTQRTTARKMSKEPPERKIKRLVAYFPYRGDKLPWTTHININAETAVDRMLFDQNNTGYYLTWEVWYQD